jgi:hypothetical protein
LVSRGTPVSVGNRALASILIAVISFAVWSLTWR